MVSTVARGKSYSGGRSGAYSTLCKIHCTLLRNQRSGRHSRLLGQNISIKNREKKKKNQSEGRPIHWGDQLPSSRRRRTNSSRLHALKWYKMHLSPLERKKTPPQYAIPTQLGVLPRRAGRTRPPPRPLRRGLHLLVPRVGSISSPRVSPFLLLAPLSRSRCQIHFIALRFVLAVSSMSSFSLSVPFPRSGC